MKKISRGSPDCRKTGKAGMQKTLADYIQELKEKGNRVIFYWRTPFRNFPVTADEFYKKICGISSAFEQFKLQKGDKVVLWGNNSPDWAACFFACIMKGLIAVPLDIRGSAEFTAKVLQLARAKLVICDAGRKEQIKEGKTVTFDEILGMSKQALFLELTPQAKPDDVAELLFTSGTTGEPKGVVLTHRNIVSNVEAIKELMSRGFYSNEKWLSILPLSHIFEQTIGLWTALRSGYPVTYLETVKASLIFESIAEDGITICPVVPRFLKLFQAGILREAERKGKAQLFEKLRAVTRRLPYGMRRLCYPAIKKKFGTLKYFIVGGARLEKDLEQFWEDLGFPILQGYGLSETSPVISCNFPGARRLGSIGKVLPGVSVKLSEEGEIWARGMSVFQGYYERPDMTREVFRDGWFKTGDLGSLDEDGFLWFKGRVKETIVTESGLNVYPQDIEALIHQIPGIKESCVLALEEKGKVQIHAALLLEKPGIDLKMVMKRANEQLADYQKIQSISAWPHEDFPRTSTMKIKKNLVLEGLKKREEIISPASPGSSSRLIQLIARIADLEPGQIWPESSLEELGLSSLDRMELAAAIEEEFRIIIDDTALVSSVTIAQIEQMLREGKGSSGEIHIPEWPASRLIFPLRLIFQNAFIFPLLRVFCKIQAEGVENLKTIRGPVIFISNHVSYFDAAVIAAALPEKIRRQLAMAGWREFFEPETKNIFHRIGAKCLFYFCGLSFNVFLFSQSKGFTKNFQHAGRLVDRGFHLLFFPEGERTPTGKMLEFRKGLEVMVKNMRIPVVPVGLQGLYEIYPRYGRRPKRGRVSCRFGKPVEFDALGDDPVRLLRQEVLKLSGGQETAGDA